jgi:hypothetical protein
MKSKPGWLNDYDAQRLGAYKTYDDMYHSNPGTYELMIRGTDDLPIYIPTAKNVVNTLARYVGRGFDFAVDQEVGTPNNQKLAQETFGKFFRRERFLSKFATGKKEWLKFGDWFWYLQADMAKPEGTRLSLKAVDPGLMFEITPPDDPDRVVGWDMVEQIKVGDDQMIQRQRWLKNTSPDHPNFGNPEAPVWYQKVQMELEGWETDKPKGLKVLSEMLLPAMITQLPIYHIKNNEETGNPYGSSELRSIERVIAAINQAVTDQDLALAIAGLGIYKSSQGGPVDGNGQETDWILGPGEVVEDPEFDRVGGVGSVSPSLDHIKYLEASIDKVSGITDVTRGEVSADVAASGVALAIRMAPTIDAANEKDLAVKDVMDQLFFDLKTWFKVFEGVDFLDCEITCVSGQPPERDPRAGHAEGSRADLRRVHHLGAAGEVRHAVPAEHAGRHRQEGRGGCRCGRPVRFPDGRRVRRRRRACRLGGLTDEVGHPALQPLHLRHP